METPSYRFRRPPISLWPNRGRRHDRQDGLWKDCLDCLDWGDGGGTRLVLSADTVLLGSLSSSSTRMSSQELSFLPSRRQKWWSFRSSTRSIEQSRRRHEKEQQQRWKSFLTMTMNPNAATTRTTALWSACIRQVHVHVKIWSRLDRTQQAALMHTMNQWPHLHEFVLSSTNAATHDDAAAAVNANGNPVTRPGASAAARCPARIGLLACTDLTTLLHNAKQLQTLVLGETVVLYYTCRNDVEALSAALCHSALALQKLSKLSWHGATLVRATVDADGTILLHTTTGAVTATTSTTLRPQPPLLAINPSSLLPLWDVIADALATTDSPLESLTLTIAPDYNWQHMNDVGHTTTRDDDDDGNETCRIVVNLLPATVTRLVATSLRLRHLVLWTDHWAAVALGLLQQQPTATLQRLRLSKRHVTAADTTALSRVWSSTRDHVAERRHAPCQVMLTTLSSWNCATVQPLVDAWSTMNDGSEPGHIQPQHLNVVLQDGRRCYPTVHLATTPRATSDVSQQPLPSSCQCQCPYALLAAAMQRNYYLTVQLQSDDICHCSCSAQVQIQSRSNQLGRGELLQQSYNSDTADSHSSITTPTAAWWVRAVQQLAAPYDQCDHDGGGGDNECLLALSCTYEMLRMQPAAWIPQLQTGPKSPSA